MSREYIPLKVQLAAALVQIGEIPFEHAKAMTPDQIISLFAKDHTIYKTWEESPGEFDKHWNLVWRFRGAHIEKTKTDVGIIAKVDRLSEAHIEFRRKMLGKNSHANDAEPVERKGKIPSRPFQKVKRRLQSRNTLRRSTREREFLET